MKQLIDILGRNIRFTDERFAHIEGDHPEMEGQFGKISETLLQPDIIVKSRTDSEVDLFYRYYLITPVAEKYMCVVVKNRIDDIFIITAYFTDAIKRGEVLWEKK
ncbi:MAG TPA: PBECR2 nuclease fold domain-containing protein [Syntrophales bacterium]|nr:PBECR2 nuclease fold domain-containing protein [Syntrophales bacterium]